VPAGFQEILLTLPGRKSNACATRHQNAHSALPERLIGDTSRRVTKSMRRVYCHFQGCTMNRLTRDDLAAAIVALGLACFGTIFWLFYAYFSSHPKQPNAALGFIHALNNHGSYVYLTDAEATGLGLLWITFFVSVLLAGMARSGGTDLASLTARLKIIFCCSFLICIGAIYLAGQSIANFAVSHGIILHI